MTISLTSDDRTFEQVKKQLNRSVEVIKVIDLTDVHVHLKELMFIKVFKCQDQDMDALFRISRVYGVKRIDYVPGSVLIKSVQTEEENTRLAVLLKKCFMNRVEIVRGGSVGMEANGEGGGHRWSPLILVI